MFLVSQFNSCRYGRQLLENRNSGKYEYQSNDGKVFVIRGFHWTFSEINQIINQFTRTPDSISKINFTPVYAFNIDGEIEPNYISTNQTKI